MTNSSSHVASLIGGEQVFANDHGSITQVTPNSLPVLQGMSIKRITLAVGAIREPQWNVNANQIAYVVRGKVLVSTLGSGDSFSSFVVDTGQMYHVESGAIYHIENVGEQEAEIIASLRTGTPQHFSLQNSFNAMSNAVLGNTYDLSASKFDVFDRHHASQITHRNGPAQIPDTAGLPNARLFDMSGQVPPLSYDYGSARLGRKQFWAALDDLSMYELIIGHTGMREPHWHPVTAELGYAEWSRPDDRAGSRRFFGHLRTIAWSGLLRTEGVSTSHRGLGRGRHPLPHLL